MLGCRTHRACINLRLSSDAPRNEICRWRTRRHSRHRVPDRKRCWIRSNSAFYLCVFGGVHIAFAKRGLSRRLRLPPACAGRRASLRANPVVARATRPLHSPFADPLVGERPSARHGDELDDRSGAVLGNRYGERMGGRFGRRVRGGQDRLRRLLRCCLRSLCRTAGPPRRMRSRCRRAKSTGGQRAPLHSTMRPIRPACPTALTHTRAKITSMRRSARPSPHVRPQWAARPRACPLGRCPRWRRLRVSNRSMQSAPFGALKRDRAISLHRPRSPGTASRRATGRRLPPSGSTRHAAGARWRKSAARRWLNGSCLPRLGGACAAMRRWRLGHRARHRSGPMP